MKKCWKTFGVEEPFCLVIRLVGPSESEEEVKNKKSIFATGSVYDR